MDEIFFPTFNVLCFFFFTFFSICWFGALVNLPWWIPYSVLISLNSTSKNRHFFFLLQFFFLCWTSESQLLETNLKKLFFINREILFTFLLEFQMKYKRYVFWNQNIHFRSLFFFLIILLLYSSIVNPSRVLPFLLLFSYVMSFTSSSLQTRCAQTEICGLFIHFKLF